MGHKTSKVDVCVATENPFKLFEYQCSRCRAKRPIQYFHQMGKFLPQNPRVVCGECNTSVMVEPFKTVEFGCPSCKKWQKARLPARPIPLNMYNVSVVSCNCGFKGEVSVGRLMDVACSQCWQHRRELCDVWVEDGEELKHYCGTCQDNKRCFAQAPKKKGEQPNADLEYACEHCKQVRPVHAEELLRNEGLVCCTLCNWVGYPQIHARGHFDKSRERQQSSVQQSGAQHRGQAKPAAMSRSQSVNALAGARGARSDAVGTASAQSWKNSLVGTPSARGARSSKVKPEPDNLSVVTPVVPDASQSQTRSSSSLGV